MTVATRSKFYYGFNIDSTNNKLDFNEGAGALVATLASGTYTITEIQSRISSALNAAGTLTYITALDRTTRKFTVSATGSFDLLISSGSNSGSTGFTLIGFTGADITGLASYESDSSAGFEFKPQFLLQKYVSSIDNQRAATSSVNVSGNGNVVEAVSFGNEKFMKLMIAFQTDITIVNSDIENDASGVSNFRNFMEYAITKGRLEFMEDRDTPGSFLTYILESTPESKDGTGFELKEMYSKGLAGFFESGKLTFREVT